MHVGVCDFPSAYAFPPRGYGGIERWLWAVAIGARQAGADVTLLGPQWRRDIDGFDAMPIRLEDVHPGDRAKLRSLRRFNLFVVGHEYPSLPAWRAVFDQLGGDVATFQHSSEFNHAPGAFDGEQSRLYCYSAEMIDRYAEHGPRAELAVHLGTEEERRAVDGKDLVWLGRIGAEKAPHIAILAATRLRRVLHVVGPVFDREYLARHASLFETPNVRWHGELGGEAKASIVRDAAVLVYTCAPMYVEAGAAVFGEAVRAGTPVAALAWRDGTCADAALCEATGRIARVPVRVSDDEAADALAGAIEHAAALKAADVQEIGMARFDPTAHFIALSSRT